MKDLVGWYFMAFDDCEETRWDGIVLAKLDHGLFYLIQDLTRHYEPGHASSCLSTSCMKTVGCSIRLSKS
jgi:hypothetical protein